MEEFVYNISQFLTIKLTTSSKDLINLFDTRFGDLYHENKNTDNQITLSLVEVPKFEIDSKKVLREITLPEYCVYDKDKFLIVQDRRYISIPFSDIGINRSLEIKFEKGFPPDWIRRLIDDILAFHVSGFGMSFIHAACLTGRDNEIVIPAWRGTGKTTLTLSLLFSKQYGYKAEDQFFIDHDANCFPYTDACHVDLNHMKEFAQIRERYFSPINAFRSFLCSIFLPIFPPVNRVFEFIRRVILKVLSPKAYVKIRDFIPDMQINHTTGKGLIFIQLITQPNLKKAIVEKTDSNKLIDEILGGMQYERLDLYQYYYAWVYASGKRNKIVDNVHTIEREVLKHAFNDAKCYKIFIPIGFKWDSYIEELDRIINSK